VATQEPRTEDLVQFWLGHTNKSAPDGCSKLSDVRDFRVECAEKIGSGFVIPPSSVNLVSMVPKSEGLARFEQALAKSE
jgi:hypothetical protein